MHLLGGTLGNDCVIDAGGVKPGTNGEETGTAVGLTGVLALDWAKVALVDTAGVTGDDIFLTWYLSILDMSSSCNGDKRNKA